MKESPLSHVKVTLREDGTIAITYSSVPVSGIDTLFQKEYPDYPYLSSLKNYMQDLDVITQDYLDAIDRLQVSD